MGAQVGLSSICTIVDLSAVTVHDQVTRIAMVAHDSIHLPDRRVALAMHACHDHHQRIRTRPWSLWLSL